jgi:hypothetical protein
VVGQPGRAGLHRRERSLHCAGVGRHKPDSYHYRHQHGRQHAERLGQDMALSSGDAQPDASVRVARTIRNATVYGHGNQSSERAGAMVGDAGRGNDRSPHGFLHCATLDRLFADTHRDRHRYDRPASDGNGKHFAQPAADPRPGFESQVYATTQNQLPIQAGLYRELSSAMGAFYAAVSQMGRAQDVTTYTDSEYSRTMVPNDRTGTDPAWGGHHLVMGGSVIGGNVHGVFPDLVPGGRNDAEAGDMDSHQFQGPICRYAGELVRRFLFRREYPYSRGPADGAPHAGLHGYWINRIRFRKYGVRRSQQSPDRKGAAGRNTLP